MFGKKSCKMLNAYFSPFIFGRCSYSRRFVVEERIEREWEKILHTVLRHYIPIVRTNGRIEEESIDVLSRAPALECSRGFSSTGADAPYQEGEWKGMGKWFWKCYWFISRTRVIKQYRNKGYEFSIPLCLSLGGIYMQPLLLSSDSSLYPSHFMCSHIQRVSLLVNLRCDKACNLIVALFPLWHRGVNVRAQRTTFHGRTIPSDPPGRRKKD